MARVKKKSRQGAWRFQDYKIYIYLFLGGRERGKSSKIRRNDLLNRSQDKRIKNKSLVELFKREGHISKRVESDLQEQCLKCLFEMEAMVDESIRIVCTWTWKKGLRGVNREICIYTYILSLKKLSRELNFSVQGF